MFCATMEIATPSASPTASRATIVVGRVRIGRMAQAHHEGATMPTTIAPSGLADVNGIQLAYQTFGDDGPAPLVLLHGGFGSMEMFGPNIAAFAAGRRVVGVDLQSHGRSPAADRPMAFESMADDIAALIDALRLGRADILGFSLGGTVALRLGIQHPDRVRRLVLVSTVVRRSAWYPEMVAGFDAMGPETAEFMRRTPMFETYKAIAPNVDDFQTLVTQLTTQLKEDYDWSDEAARLPMPVMIVAGDADGLPPRSAVELFELLGGGQRDAGWDRSGMSRHRLAVLPGVTHYEINVSPALAAAVTPFLDEA
jgi:pimeloyl-ACP methyl ester carboxylesterase